MSLFLKNLGAKVYGYSLLPEKGNDALYNLVQLEKLIESKIGDVRNLNLLSDYIKSIKPNIVFHLAAQPLVLDSYKDPIYNFSTNIMGTVNLLEACKEKTSVKALINITTDKCYENKESLRPYKETDKLGGYDPYSASKACSEIVTSSYKKSFLKQKKIGVATARAGNVIGGGDFSRDRIIPDILRSIQNKKILELRNPRAVRPWQHVYDVIYGYLLLGENLYKYPDEFSDSFNFSPNSSSIYSVEDIVMLFINQIGDGTYKKLNKKNGYYESQLLRLSSQKSRHKLKWRPFFNVKNAIKNTAKWYKGYLENTDIKQMCLYDISEFLKLMEEK